MPLFWQGFCPHGQLCRKKGKQIAWNQDREVVVDAVANHLCSSTYHNFEWEAARIEADSDACIVQVEYDDEVEVFDEQAPEGMEAAVDEGKDKSKGQSKGKKGKGTKGSGSGSGSSSSRAGRGTQETRLILRAKSRSRSPKPRSITIRASKLQTIMDSLERAAQASEYSATLSRSAAKAFDDQAATLRNSQRLLADAMANS